MNSQTLREARKYEEATEKIVTEQERPAFHLSSRIGWMNDPNGFSFYQGKYHMFYQYHPYSCVWGPMHWGHAVSTDLLRWEYLPAAIAPDSLYDRDGCFSGSAIEMPDGRQLLMYTGVRNEIDAAGGKREVQTQCIAIGDGIDYEKYEGNPVITEEKLPEGASRYDFRDPKILRLPDGSYRCVIGSRPADGSGQLLLYGSEDAVHWSFRKVLAENRNRFGLMWECPDFFELDGKWVILTSPQDMLPQDFEYHNGNGTLCLIGDYDQDTETFSEQYNQSIDYGIDFYAPQTVLAPDGRRIMIGWMQNWDSCNLKTVHGKWYGQMSLPREIHVRDGRLYQQPIRELDEMRVNRVEHKNVKVDKSTVLEGVSGRLVDMEIHVYPDEAEEMYQKFAIRFARNDIYQTTVSFRPHESVMKIDRKFSGSRRAVIHQRRCKVRGKHDGRIDLRIILDRYSAEVFINGGEQVMTASFYTPLEAQEISFKCIGTARMDIVKYDLRKK